MVIVIIFFFSNPNQGHQVQIDQPQSSVHAPRASISSSVIAQASLEQQNQPLVQMIFPYQVKITILIRF